MPPLLVSSDYWTQVGPHIDSGARAIAYNERVIISDYDDEAFSQMVQDINPTALPAKLNVFSDNGIAIGDNDNEYTTLKHISDKRALRIGNSHGNLEVGGHVGHNNYINNCIQDSESVLVFGQGLTADNSRCSLVFGQFLTADNSGYSLLLGTRSTTTACTSSLVFGQNLTADNSGYSLLMGAGSTTTACSSSLVFGQSLTADNSNFSLLLGAGATTTECESSLVFGQGLTANNSNFSLMMGAGSTATWCTRSLVFGQDLTAHNSSESLFMGSKLTTSGCFNSLVFGTSNCQQFEFLFIAGCWINCNSVLKLSCFWTKPKCR